MPELVCSSGDPAWAREAQAGVTGADIVAILGFNDDAVSPYALYWVKKGVASPRPYGDRARLDMALRGYALDCWAAENGPETAWNPGSLWRSDDRPWQLAATDYDVHADREGYHPDLPVAPLAVATWDDDRADDWEDGLMPPEFRARLLWQMDVLAADRGHAGILFLPSGRFLSMITWHDQYAHEQDQACTVCDDQEMLRDAGHRFHRGVLGELPAPGIDGSDSTLEALKERWKPSPRSACEVDANTWSQFKEARHLAKTWESQAKALEIVLRNEAGDATYLTVDRKAVARRVTRKVTGASWTQDTYRALPGGAG